MVRFLNEFPGLIWIAFGVILLVYVTWQALKRDKAGKSGSPARVGKWLRELVDILFGF